METKLIETKLIDSESAKKVVRWITSGLGVAAWYSKMLEDNGAEVLTPLRFDTGERRSRPGWRYGEQPDEEYESLDDFSVLQEFLYKSIPVALTKSYGMNLVLTDHAKAKLNKVLAEARKQYEMVWYEFGEDPKRMYPRAYVKVANGSIPLREWMAQHAGVQDREQATKQTTGEGQ